MPLWRSNAAVRSLCPPSRLSRPFLSGSCACLRVGPSVDRFPVPPCDAVTLLTLQRGDLGSWASPGRQACAAPGVSAFFSVPHPPFFCLFLAAVVVHRNDFVAGNWLCCALLAAVARRFFVLFPLRLLCYRPPLDPLQLLAAVMVVQSGGSALASSILPPSQTYAHRPF